MLAERIQSRMVRLLSTRYLKLAPTRQTQLPGPLPQRKYMLYMHVPFCERLCPYCSFNRFPLEEQRARKYFSSMREEMRMLKELGYDFTSLYVGGGTPTILMDELTRSLDLARELFHIREVSCETNPNHLIPEILDQLSERVQRLSVGVQSFDDGLLKQMDRYDKYGSAAEMRQRVELAARRMDNLNVDMIFNFPSQSEQMLRYDLACILDSGVRQTTFYPLMASPAVERSLAATAGQVDYSREARYYQIISETLTGGAQPVFRRGSAWTFQAIENGMIDEYIVDYEEYPAIGSGGLSFLDGSLYVNTFSLREYSEKIAAGQMSLMGRTLFSQKDRMRYRFMMELFGLRLDKKKWRRDFGCGVAAGAPEEYAFFKLAGAIATDTDDELTLTPKGCYLMVALMRQFFIGVNDIRDQARNVLPEDERKLIFG
ncbi:MAG: coproporphyrinogen III oxidase family protein [Peptococcaceae bacterium]|jgi:coproporphyrinogen III oxidase-like Fe-S oxidoreductase|nr:coproporphyrinogen III oxidase family protein [Peptococcaceae bacterium]